MIHYHGTPIGGDSVGAIRFLKGRHALVSFAYPQQISAVIEATQSFVLDNGAFTTWKQGGTLDVDGYYQWVSDFHKHPSFDWALIPDIIGGSERDNDALLSDWPNNLTGVPVYHMHESIDRLVRLANTYKIVALGSSGEYPSPGTSKWWDRMDTMLRSICDADGSPPCKLHGLRMLNPEIFSKIPLSSADSTNAAVNNHEQLWKTKLGKMSPTSAWQRSAIIADRVESYNSSGYWRGVTTKEPKILDFF